MRKTLLSASIDKDLDARLQTLWIEECKQRAESGRPPRSRSQLVNDLLREALSRRTAT